MTKSIKQLILIMLVALEGLSIQSSIDPITLFQDELTPELIASDMGKVEDLSRYLDKELNLHPSLLIPLFNYLNARAFGANGTDLRDLHLQLMESEMKARHDKNAWINVTISKINQADSLSERIRKMTVRTMEKFLISQKSIEKNLIEDETSTYSRARKNYIVLKYINSDEVLPFEPNTDYSVLLAVSFKKKQEDLLKGVQKMKNNDFDEAERLTREIVHFWYVFDESSFVPGSRVSVTKLLIDIVEKLYHRERRIRYGIRSSVVAINKSLDFKKVIGTPSFMSDIAFKTNRNMPQQSFGVRMSIPLMKYKLGPSQLDIQYVHSEGQRGADYQILEDKAYLKTGYERVHYPGNGVRRIEKVQFSEYWYTFTKMSSDYIELSSPLYHLKNLLRLDFGIKFCLNSTTYSYGERFSHMEENRYPGIGAYITIVSPTRYFVDSGEDIEYSSFIVEPNLRLNLTPVDWAKIDLTFSYNYLDIGVGINVWPNRNSLNN